MTTAHAIGQHEKARLQIAHVIDTAPPGTDSYAVGRVILDQLLDLGWTPPRDIVEAAPPRPAEAADEDSPGRREFRAAMAELANRPRSAH